MNKKPSVVIPVGTSFVGTLSADKLAKLAAIEAAQIKTLEAESAQLKKDYEKACESLATLSSDKYLTDEVKEAKKKEVADLAAQIRENKEKMGKPFLGVFKPGEIKGRLAVLNARVAGTLASYKKTVDSPVLSGLESKAIEAQKDWNEKQVVRKEAKAIVETATASKKTINKELVDATSYDSQKSLLDRTISSVETAKAAMAGKVQGVKDLTSTQTEAYKAKYEKAAKRLNVMQATLTGLLTGIKPNYDSVKGLEHGYLLTASTINNITSLNNAIEKITEYSAENDGYFDNVSELERALSSLDGQLVSLKAELATVETEVAAKEVEKAAAKEAIKESRSAHRASVIAASKENIKLVEAGEEQKVISVYDPTEVNAAYEKAVTEISNLLEKKSRILDEVNCVEHEQNEKTNKLNQINSLIELNERIIRNLFERVGKIQGSYEEGFLDSIIKDENPFGVEVDKEGLARILK